MYKYKSLCHLKAFSFPASMSAMCCIERERSSPISSSCSELKCNASEKETVSGLFFLHFFAVNCTMNTLTQKNELLACLLAILLSVCATSIRHLFTFERINIDNVSS